jgi:hypothetical protein
MERPGRNSACRITLSKACASGGLFPLKGLAQDPNPRRMTVWLREERWSLSPFGVPGQRTMVTPDKIAFEKRDGALGRRAPRA